MREAVEAVNRGELKPNEDENMTNIEGKESSDSFLNTGPISVSRNFMPTRTSNEDDDSDAEEDQLQVMINRRPRSNHKHLQGRLEIVRGSALSEAPSKSVRSLEFHEPRYFQFELIV